MPEKPEITKIHLLVHPFYGLKEPFDGWHADPKRKMNYTTYRPDLPIDYLRYQKYLARVWGQLVQRIASNPKEVLIFVPLNWKVSRETRFLGFLEETLSGFFNNKMPMRQFSVKDIGFPFAKNAIDRLNSRFNVDWSTVSLEAHGEMSNICVNQFLQRIALASGNPELHSQAVGVIEKPAMQDSRVKIGQETTELARGKERYLVRHEPLPRKGTPERLEQLARFRDRIRKERITRFRESMKRK